MRTRLERTGGLDGHEGSVVVEADEVVVQMSLPVRILRSHSRCRRGPGSYDEGPAVRSGAPRSLGAARCSGASREPRTDDVAFVTATGSSEELVQAICIATRPASNWVEVTESFRHDGGVAAC